MPGAEIEELESRPEVGRLPATLKSSHHEIERLRGELVRMDHADFDLLALTDDEFAKALQADRKRQERIETIVKNRLVEGQHFGIPTYEHKGKQVPVPGIKKPFLYQAGAEKLRELFRYTIRHVEPAVVVADKEGVSVTVTVGVFDSLGRLICTRSGNCNSKEKRFRRSGGAGWIYEDPREQVHGCFTMAEKRAGVLATREATGTSALFANPEELDRVTEPAEEIEPADPWSEEEKTKVYKAAKALGFSRDGFDGFVRTTLGRSFVGSGDDVVKLLGALEIHKQTAHKPVATGGYAGEGEES